MSIRPVQHNGETVFIVHEDEGEEASLDFSEVSGFSEEQLDNDFPLFGQSREFDIDFEDEGDEDDFDFDDGFDED